MIETNDPSFLKAIELMDHPQIMLEKLRELLIPAGSVDMAQTVVSWFRAENRDENLTVSKMSQENQVKFEKIKHLSKEQINAFVFLNGLSSKYNTITQEFLSKANFTAQEVYLKQSASPRVNLQFFQVFF